MMRGGSHGCDHRRRAGGSKEARTIGSLNAGGGAEFHAAPRPRGRPREPLSPERSAIAMNGGSVLPQTVLLMFVPNSRGVSIRQYRFWSAVNASLNI
jgi:hypothetical protein